MIYPVPTIIVLHKFGIPGSCFFPPIVMIFSLKNNLKNEEEKMMIELFDCQLVNRILNVELFVVHVEL